MSKLKVNNDFINARLDRWFKKNVSDVPQSLIEKSLRKGNIKVNDKKVRSSYKLKIDDEIFIKNLSFKSSSYKKKENKYQPTKKETRYSSSIIIENNENFVVINKPAGIAVQSGTKSKKNIIDMLRKTEEFKNTIPYTVHRIDKETTGVMLVAKNRRYAQLLTSLFRIRKVHKTYLCIVLGEFNSKKGSFKDELFHYEGDKKIITKALTHFHLLDSNNNYSLLKLNPETGRKHQLRKHLLLHGHPILGDSKYRLKKNKRNNNSQLMLHASKINFSINGIKFSYTADIPDTFRDTLKEKYLKIY